MRIVDSSRETQKSKELENIIVPLATKRSATQENNSNLLN
jgi:hypothetical protein